MDITMWEVIVYDAKIVGIASLKDEKENRKKYSEQTLILSHIFEKDILPVR
jgi:hypothetical protein